jgi:DNA-binding response OmpR family regulator
MIALTESGRRKTVLVVEDDVQASGGMKRLLEHYGCEVVVAGSVAEGLKGLAGKPDFVFLDLGLPDGEGTRVLERVRAEGLASRVIVMSGLKERVALWRAASLKPEAMLSKPVDFLRVLELMRAAA